MLDYGSRRYDPELGRFIQPDSIVPEQSQGVQAWDRYAYANNSPVVNADPSGHCIWDGCLVEIIALAGLTIAASQIPSDVPQSNPADWGNPDVMVTGLAITAGAPDIAALAGEGLMGLGKLISNPKLFAAGKAAYDSATGAEAAAAIRQTPNEIGTWGEQQVGENLPVNIQHQPVVDPVTGRLRIYDGNFETDPNAFVEVKTSTRGVVYANQFNRQQISSDANIGEASGTSPTWIFVNARPSGPLINLMQQNRIPWHQLNLPR